jgi:hypothetical protein
MVGVTEGEGLGLEGVGRLLLKKGFRPGRSKLNLIISS